MRKVYIVEGSTGEYSDHHEWPVAAYLHEEHAAQRVLDCQRGALAAFADAGGQDEWRYNYAKDKPTNAYDPDMSVDYTGVNYRYYTVDLVDG